MTPLSYLSPGEGFVSQVRDLQWGCGAVLVSRGSVFAPWGCHLSCSLVFMGFMGSLF